MKTIEAIINVDGTTVLVVGGVQGPSCADVVQALAQGLGEAKKAEKKPEYYQTESGGQHVKG